MQRVQLKADDLDRLNRTFDQRELRQPLFLNSVPKSGTHLLRNILRMFVPVPQQYKREFIQHAILQQHRDAFDRRMPLLSWGHLYFSDQAAAELSGVRKILQVRDPYSWVLAMARFLQSEQFSGLEQLKSDSVTAEQLFNVIIFGVQGQPGLAEFYTRNAVAWLGTDAYLVRYEELVQAVRAGESDESASYFAQLFDACGIDPPSDWRERVRIGADPAQSGTAQENLDLRREMPRELPAMQKTLVDYAAPGLRHLLGYE